MNLPFTVEQFFDVFGAYNEAIWPAQIIAYALGVMAIVPAIRDSKHSGRLVSSVLALFWVWMGVFYHIVHFSTINPTARLFGVCFILQGLLFLLFGSIQDRLSFHFAPELHRFVGACFVLYAMIIYPLLGRWAGHAYPRTPMFGVAPCPATIFTFGLLLWGRNQIPIYLVVIPLLWSLIGISAALKLGVPQDYGLGVAGVLGTILIVHRNRQLKTSTRRASDA